jgi:UDP-GlcNAc:undecaprenyl-phosphate/decaprenyl-phosphate GlcNAc-1-phosphate transferase
LGLGLLVFWPLFFRARWIVDASLTTSFSDRSNMGFSMVLVFIVGWYDDYRAGQARGIRGHFKELARGRVTPGTLKLVGIVAAATVVTMSLADDLVQVLLGIPVIAGSANLWNLLDVRPGRALKWFLVAALVLVGWYARYDDFLLGAAIGSAAALLVFDLRERAMLGDAGSNLLGFIVGIALFRVLPTWGLGIALAVILALHAVGETVTLSRVIETSPPLRWFDRLGRLSADQTKPDPGPQSRDSSST